MKEYIEREAAIKARGRSCDMDCSKCDFAIEGDSWCDGEVFVVDLLRIPAADVQPVVRGKWRLGGYGQISDATEKWYDKYLQGGFLYCSVCKGRTSVKFNFCPNCGADMRGEQDV